MSPLNLLLLILPLTLVASFNAHDEMHVRLESKHLIHIAGGYGFGVGGKANIDLKR